MQQHLDRDRLVKLLARLRSDSDAEVLTAARKAVALMQDAGADWDGIISHRGGSGVRGWIDGWGAFAAESRRRAAAEKSAEHWQGVARRLEAQLADARSPLSAAPGSHPSQGPRPAPGPRPSQGSHPSQGAANDSGTDTGHEVIDRLLASPRLDATARARVEAIASWFRRTRELTGAELADLENFARAAGLRSA
jgi:hypothetical protein